MVPLAENHCMIMTRCYRSLFLTLIQSSLSNVNSADTLARRIHVIERLEHLLVIRLSSRFHGKESPLRPKVELKDGVIASKLLDSARIRCVCLPDYKHAQILLRFYLQSCRPLYQLPHLCRLESFQEEMYAQLSRAEIPNLTQISLFLSVFAAGARYGMTNDRRTICLRYWQMTALYILAEQRQTNELGSVEDLQTIVNILLLMRHQQGSSETFHLLYALGMSLSSEPPTVIEDETSTGTRSSLRCQIERMNDISPHDKTKMC
jgi:hypothetical protein